jgi:hypothetical protein
VAQKQLVTLRFGGGGPWDGHGLVAEAPPDDTFAMEGGHYFLHETRPPLYPGAEGIAFYWWAPRRSTLCDTPSHVPQRMANKVTGRRPGKILRRLWR